MAGIGIPLEDNYEATLTQALAGSAGALTMYVSKTPVCTIPAGQYVVLTINPGKGATYQENVLMESYDSTAKTITIKTGGRAQERYAGDSPSALAHAVGSKIIMSDAYPVWNSLDDYVSDAGDTMTGQLNFSGTDHAGVKMISLTTAQRTALTGANGMLVYDTDIGELYQYIGGAWSAVSAGSTQPNASETVAGKIELATAAERAAGTATGGTGAKLVPTNDALVKTSSGAGDENKIPVLDATGKLATGFIPATGLAIEALSGTGTAAEALTDQDVLTFATSGRLARADADATATTFPFAGIATAAAAGAGSSASYTPAGSIIDIPSISVAEHANGVLTALTPTNTTQNTATDVQDASTKWRGQTFTASANAWETNIASVTLYLTKTGSPTGNATVAIYATSGGLPTGAALGSQTLAYSSISTGANTFTFTTPVEITPSTVYAIVLNPGAGVSGAAYIAWNYQNTNVYADGQSCTSADSGANWTAEATYDRYFSMKYGAIYGCPAFIDDTTGAITLAVNAAGTNKYNQRIGYVVDRTHLMVERGLRNIYATYSFTADSTTIVSTEITIGFRPMLVFAQAFVSGGIASVGMWMSGGASFSLENKVSGLDSDGGKMYKGEGSTDLCRMTPGLDLNTSSNYIQIRLLCASSSANTLTIQRALTETGTASCSVNVYLNIIGW